MTSVRNLLASCLYGHQRFPISINALTLKRISKLSGVKLALEENSHAAAVKNSKCEGFYSKCIHYRSRSF